MKATQKQMMRVPMQEWNQVKSSLQANSQMQQGQLRVNFFFFILFT